MVTTLIVLVLNVGVALKLMLAIVGVAVVSSANTPYVTLAGDEARVKTLPALRLLIAAPAEAVMVLVTVNPAEPLVKLKARAPPAASEGY